MIERFGRSTAAGTQNSLALSLVTLPVKPDSDEFQFLSSWFENGFRGNDRIRAALLARIGKSDASQALYQQIQLISPLRGNDLILRSMNSMNLSRPDDAREWLRRAREWIAEADRVAVSPVTWSDIRWNEWNEAVETRLLLNEAESRFEKAEPARN